MKYCTKCGNELFDEAVICPKCGCPADPEKKTNLKEVGNKIKTALVLNLIAFPIALFTILNFILAAGDPSADEATRNTYVVMLSILALVTISFILCLTNVFAAKKGHAKIPLLGST